METRKLPQESVALVIEKQLSQLDELALMLRELGDQKARQFYQKQCDETVYAELPDSFDELGNLIERIEQTIENATRPQIEMLIATLQDAHQQILFDDKVRQKVQRVCDALTQHVSYYPDKYSQDPLEATYTRMMEMMDELTKKATHLEARERALAAYHASLEQQSKDIQTMHQSAQRMYQEMQILWHSAQQQSQGVAPLAQTEKKESNGMFSQLLSSFGMYTGANVSTPLTRAPRQTTTQRAPEKPMRIG